MNRKTYNESANELIEDLVVTPYYIPIYVFISPFFLVYFLKNPTLCRVNPQSQLTYEICFVLVEGKKTSAPRCSVAEKVTKK